MSTARTLRRPLAAAAAAVVLGALALGQAPASGAATAGRTPGKLAPATGALFGAYVRPFASWSKADQQAAITKRETDVGRKYDLGHYYYEFATAFPTWRETWNADNGRSSMISWAGAQSTVVNSGALDATIAARADAVKASAKPVMVRYFWEMDATANAARAGTPEQFVAAWKRIHDTFRRRGATNAVWVWCPTAYGFANGNAPKYYPGDAYVDWTCADGYNWAGSTWVKNPTPRSFKDIFAAYYAWGTARPKPMMVGETGALERGPGVKAAWLNEARTTLKTTYPAIAALVWYDSDSGDNWRADTSASAYDAYKAMGRDPYFRPAR